MSQEYEYKCVATLLPNGEWLYEAYTLDGYYIGTEEFARNLFKRGIMPEARAPDVSVCSIGFCEREQKWYGWSHRAMCSFSIGDTVKTGDAASEYLPVGFVAHSLAGAKDMAKAYARAIS